MVTSFISLKSKKKRIGFVFHIAVLLQFVIGFLHRQWEFKVIQTQTARRQIHQSLANIIE